MPVTGLCLPSVLAALALAPNAKLAKTDALPAAAPAGQAAQASGRETGVAGDEQQTTARAQFSLAEKAFNLGDFDDALAGYEAAYQTKPLPALLFNIAQCHRNLERPERALFFYERYLTLEPTTPNRPIVESLAAEMRRRSQQQAQALSTAVLDQAQALGNRPAGRARWWLWGGVGAALAGAVLVAVASRPDPLPTGNLGAIDARR